MAVEMTLPELEANIEAILFVMGDLRPDRMKIPAAKLYII